MTRMIDVDLLIAEFEKVYPLATNEMGGVVNKKIYDIINSIPVVAGNIPNNTAGDSISRKALQDKMKEADAEAIDYEMLVAMYEKLVNDAPVVEPERLKGEWLHNSDRPDNLICSVCNSGWDMWRYESKELKYCPNCGADMRDGEQRAPQEEYNHMNWDESSSEQEESEQSGDKPSISVCDFNDGIFDPAYINDEVDCSDLGIYPWGNS